MKLISKGFGGVGGPPSTISFPSSLFLCGLATGALGLSFGQ